MINFELDWGLVIALSIGIALLVISVVWGVRLFRQALPELRRIVKAIAKYLKTEFPGHHTN